MQFCLDTAAGDGQEEGGWVVCRIFKKKYHLKTAIDMNPFRVSSSRTINTGDETINTTSQSLSFTSTDQSAGTLDQILLQYMADPPPPQQQLHPTVPILNHHCSYFNLSPSEPEFTNRFMKLPNLESPNSSRCTDHLVNSVVYQSENNSNIADWAAIDRLAARHLNGGGDDGSGSKHPPQQQLSYFGTDDATTMGGFCCPSNQDLRLQDDESDRTLIMDDEECELWSFGRPSLSSGDPLSQLSDVHV